MSLKVMKIISNILITIVFLFSNNTIAQYKLVNEITTEEKYPVGFNFSNLAYEICDGIFFQVNTNNAGILIITGADINNGQTKFHDTIYDFPAHFKIQDIAVNKYYICIIGHKKYVYFDRLTNEAHLYMNGNNDIAFVNGDFFNDSILVLHTVYNYHPKSSAQGIHINLLNLRTNKFEKTTNHEIPGVATSVINQSWIEVTNNKIIVSVPLTALLYVFDENMNKTEYKIEIFDSSQFIVNKQFEAYLDSLVDDDKEHLTQRKELNIYNKDFISRIIDTMSNNFSYIEKIFVLDNSRIGLTVSNPDNSNRYRDVYILDTKHFKVIKVIKNWQIAIPEYLEKKEDFYAVNLSSNRKMGPFFYDGYLYVPSVYPIALYSNGTADKLFELMFNNIRKNGYTCSLLKYEIN